MRSRWKVVVATAAAALVAAAAAWFIGVQVGQNTQGVNTLCPALSEILAAADQMLGQPGTAGYAYLQAHPVELANGHHQIQGELRRIGRGCP